MYKVNYKGVNFMWQKFLAWSDNFGKKANPMLKAFLIWFIFFGISFLISSLKWAEQGKVFMFIYVAWPVLLFIVGKMEQKK